MASLMGATNMNNDEPLPSLSSPSYKTTEDMEYYSSLEGAFDQSGLSTLDKLTNFSLYVPRQTLTKFLSRYEIFKRVLNINGSIVECGVFQGGGLMTFAQLSAILEPINYTRRVIGFDNFKGIERLSERDKRSSISDAGKLNPTSTAYEELKKAIALFDQNRHIGHVPKVELVIGDMLETVPKYVKEHPELIVSLLYMDCPLYEPTRAALQLLVPRVPKGGIIAFDELNSQDWPGETVAALEKMDLGQVSIRRFTFDTYVSYIVK